MAKTSDGTEFYLLEIDSAEPGAQLQELEAATRGVVRNSDAVVVIGGRIFVAVVGQVQDSAKVARRLVALIRTRGIDAKLTLVQEPLPDWAEAVAARVEAREPSMRPRG